MHSDSRTHQFQSERVRGIPGPPRCADALVRLGAPTSPSAWVRGRPRPPGCADVPVRLGARTPPSAWVRRRPRPPGCRTPPSAWVRRRPRPPGCADAPVRIPEQPRQAKKPVVHKHTKPRLSPKKRTVTPRLTRSQSGLDSSFVAGHEEPARACCFGTDGSLASKMTTICRCGMTEVHPQHRAVV